MSQQQQASTDYRTDPEWQKHHAAYMSEEGTADEKHHRRHQAAWEMYLIEAKETAE